MYRIFVTGGIAALLCLGLAGPVLGATPGNDLYVGRTAVGALPFSASLDTTEATTDADDAEANTYCGAPATDASVWYEYSPTITGDVLVDVSASDYTAGYIVALSSPGSFITVACGPSAGAFSGEAGSTYAIMLFDDQQDGAGNGGQLELTLTQAPPPPQITLTVDRTGSVNARTGIATIRGTVTCSGGDTGKTFIDAQVTQNVGRFTFSGEGITEFTCDGTPQHWSANAYSQNGRFGGGKALVTVYATACDEFGCGSAQVENVTVTLRK